MTKAKLEITLRLDSISADAHDTVSSDANDWLNNDSAELVNDLYSGVSKSSSEKNAVKGTSYKCDTLRIRATEGGYELDTGHGTVLLYEGDVIELPQGQFRVGLEQEYVVPVETKHSVNTSLPEIDDIWSTRDERVSQVGLGEPFAYNANNYKPSVVPPVHNAYLSATPLHNNFTPAPINRHHDDPLSFLYEQNPKTQTQFVAPLLVSSSMPPLSMNTNEVDKTSYLERSPVDKLDEYLSIDDHDVYPIARYTPSPQRILEAEPKVYREEPNQKKGFFAAVKQAMKTKNDNQ